MSPLELFAALVGAISVWLSVRQKIWSWPTAIVNVVLYAIVFYEAKLYADMGLQVVYCGPVDLRLVRVAVRRRGAHGAARLAHRRAARRAARADRRRRLGAPRRGRFTAPPTRRSPSWTPFLSSTSLVAQWMMTKKLLENWLVWIGVDVLYVGMFIFKGLYLTAGLYAVFLALAVKGYIDWRRSMAAQALPLAAAV